MNKPSPAQLERARRLLAHEGAANGAGTRATTAASRVYEKIQDHMGPLVGVGGVHSLFMRSAKLAQGEFARFAGVSVLESSTKLRERLQAKDPAVSTEAAATLFGTFLTLSTSFLGERLTTQVLHNAWPTFEKTEPREEHK